MSSKDADASTPTPTKEQLQFARSVYIILELWPALKQAVIEQWGGEYSEEKREFLLSHICDEYGDHGAETKPDVDDLTELIESYIVEEFDCELEDDSAALVAEHICLAHTGIFVENKGDEVLNEIEQTFSRVAPKSKRATVQDGFEYIGDGDRGEDNAAHDDDKESASAPAPPRERAPPPEPVIDEDGFEMVQSRRRR